MSDDEKLSKVRVIEDVAAVPTFGCVIYVAKTDDGKVRARVANLAGIEATAASERDALAAVVKAFKQQAAEATQNDETIPWIEPPPEPTADEQRRFIPVHL